MFDTLLIANRGEIACRVIATARRLGIKTVAVYSDADAGAAHVAMADEAVRIGPAPVAESYLRSDAILEAAKATGAQAIHPGYGFLSENPDFVDAVEAAGLVFVGPPASAIRAMGLKDAAKALMAQAGVPVVPGYHGESQDPELLAKEAEAIGYPVLIKARAGGGGKGMRLVEAPGGFRDALASARREALSSFGDPACLIEKYVTQPRHIEIQVFGDAHGNVLHLFERDCSLQRRHQKVIEEAPAPDMPADVRAAMGKAAVEAAQAIGYQGAGTVEFIADGSGPLRVDGFWFMEMNTRLQVEHPVSEAITGLDFVELQLRVAAGEPLPFAQDDLRIKGHSFEARVYAEDVPKGFLPATGRLDHLTFPEGTAFAQGPVRIDNGVRQGDEITPYYDPMIAKVIVHGPTRSAALSMLRSALGACHVAGSVTNLAFLNALAGHAGFGRGDVDTGLIQRDIEALTAPGARPDAVVAVAALTAMGLLTPASTGGPWEHLIGWRHWSQARQPVTLVEGDAQIEATVAVLGASKFDVAFDGRSMVVETQRVGETGIRVTNVDDALRHTLRVDAVRHGGNIAVFHAGRTYGFTLPDPLAAGAAEALSGDAIVAPMPGLVKAVSVATGAAVNKGETLLVLEAMKMEHALRAPRDGIVAEVMAREGDQVVDGAILIAMEPLDG